MPPRKLLSLTKDALLNNLAKRYPDFELQELKNLQPGLDQFVTYFNNNELNKRKGTNKYTFLLNSQLLTLIFDSNTQKFYFDIRDDFDSLLPEDLGLSLRVSGVYSRKRQFTLQDIVTAYNRTLTKWNIKSIFTVPDFQTICYEYDTDIYRDYFLPTTKGSLQEIYDPRSKKYTSQITLVDDYIYYLPSDEEMSHNQVINLVFRNLDDVSASYDQIIKFFDSFAIQPEDILLEVCFHDHQQEVNFNISYYTPVLTPLAAYLDKLSKDFLKTPAKKLNNMSFNIRNLERLEDLNSVLYDPAIKKEYLKYKNSYAQSLISLK